MQAVAVIGFLVIVVGLIALSFFSALLYSAVHGRPQYVNSADHRNAVAGAAGSILLFGLKRRLKRMLFLHHL